MKWLIIFVSCLTASAATQYGLLTSAPWIEAIAGQGSGFGTNEAWVTLTGNDSTGRFGDPTKPFRNIYNAISNTAAPANPPWRIYIGAGEFTNDNSIIVSNGCVLVGQGMDATTISGHFRFLTKGVLVNPRDNAQFWNLTMNQTWTNNLAAPFGCDVDSDVAQYPFTNVYCNNVRFLGKSDNLYAFHTNSGCKATFDNCWFDSGGNGWDLFANGGHTNSVFIYNYCIATARGDALIGAQTRLGNLYEGTNIFNHCTFLAVDGLSSTFGFEMHDSPYPHHPTAIGELQLNDCFLLTSSDSGSVTDIVNQVSATVIVRGPFTANKVSGTITQEDSPLQANKFAPAAFAPALAGAVAPVAITFPATGVNWTNRTGATIEVYIDNTGVTGTAVAKNGTTILAGLITGYTIVLLPNDYFSETYSVGTPTARYNRISR